LALKPDFSTWSFLFGEKPLRLFRGEAVGFWKIGGKEEWKIRGKEEWKIRGKEDRQ
jgi:hypothetical protein